MKKNEKKVRISHAKAEEEMACNSTTFAKLVFLATQLNAAQLRIIWGYASE